MVFPDHTHIQKCGSNTTAGEFVFGEDVYPYKRLWIQISARVVCLEFYFRFQQFELIRYYIIDILIYFYVDTRYKTKEAVTNLPKAFVEIVCLKRCVQYLLIQPSLFPYFDICH